MKGLYDWVVRAIMLIIKSSSKMIHLGVVNSRVQRYAPGARATTTAPIVNESR